MDLSPHPSESGQALLITVLLVVIILLVVPAIIFVNKAGTRHNITSVQKSKAVSLAQEGVAYAVQQLSTPSLVVTPAQATGPAGPGQVGNDAAGFVSESVIPTVMFPGQQIPVTVTMLNTGPSTWTPAGNYDLGAQNPQGNTNWVTTPVALAAGDSIATGSTKQFSFTITAPPTAGTYQYQWGMIIPGTHWFGLYTPNVTVQVQDPPAPPANWPYVGGTLLPSGTSYSLLGQTFNISYTAGPTTNLQAYQVGILAQPLDSQNHVTPGGSVFAAVSQKTLAVKLPTGLSASAALFLLHVPTGNLPGNSDGLYVHWGPIALLESTGATQPTNWPVTSGMDLGQFPRKFSIGGITGTNGTPVTFPRSTNSNSDGKEYWSNVNLGFPETIDLMSYLSRAQNTTSITTGPTSILTGNPITRGCPSSNPNCGHFIVKSGDVAFFNNFSDNSPDVIYVEGNAMIVHNLTVDLKNPTGNSDGAFIVTGSLTLGDSAFPNPGAGQLLTLRFPPTAPLEYPYAINAPRWPCDGHVTNSTCSSNYTQLGQNATNGLGTGGGTGNVHFRGFMYVMGGFAVTQPSLLGTTGWLFDGAMRVDGDVVVPGPPPNYTFALLYDDEINHRILTSPMELQQDSVTSGL